MMFLNNGAFLSVIVQCISNNDAFLSAIVEEPQPWRF